MPNTDPSEITPLAPPTPLPSSHLKNGDSEGDSLAMEALDSVADGTVEDAADLGSSLIDGAGELAGSLLESLGSLFD